MDERIPSYKEIKQERELKHITDANEHLNQQIDLFSAFIWRHQQKDTIPKFEAANFLATNFDQQISKMQMENLEKDFPLQTRIHMCMTEKYLTAQEIESLVSKSEKDVETLKAVLLECKERVNEIKKDAYDLKRFQMLASDNKEKNHINGEKFKRLVDDKIKAKENLVKKYKAKNGHLQSQIYKLQEQLNTTTEHENGDTFHEIDLEQLKIQNSQYNQTILEKNKELLKLKTNTGKVQELKNENKRAKTLEACINDRQQLLIKLKDELESAEKDITKQYKLYSTMKAKLANADLPQVMDYVKQKSEESKLELQLKSWQRKVEIAELRNTNTKA
ncbi:hypothetical protein RFI_02945 [Reticulomyxa filosa]|uniref:Cilia- and flagella-associated protein 263 n=1 Tax=Reticulomyxa filosa TaxID=46433 RepID=X6P7Q4_RETFI|nr:hypothetical protein RFI_02945 [Reticulomyxa filosa]|eukprot:ETO34148.1 hypothetical protein RFI_02945 [Reticulomyxa filosa]